MQWQTRWIATFIAAASPVGKELGPKVDLIDLFNEHERGRPQPPASKEPAPGSFERFMGAFQDKSGGSLMLPPTPPEPPDE